MTSTLQDEIAAATAYETLIVPALTGQWAATVVEAARIHAGDRVLDLACGTGALARAVLSRTGPRGRVTGVDRSAGMLDLARRLCSGVDWQHASADSLPFPDGSFDAVVSQFGLMFFADRRRAIAEALRVLAPGGRFAFAVWDALATMPAFATEVALVDGISGPQAAEPLRSPFALGDRDELAALFAEAGVAEIQITTSRGTARFPSVRIMMEADLRGWLPVMGVILPEPEIARLLDEAERVFRPYIVGHGTVSFETSAHIVTGAKP